MEGAITRRLLCVEKTETRAEVTHLAEAHPPNTGALRPFVTIYSSGMNMVDDLILTLVLTSPEKNEWTRAQSVFSVSQLEEQLRTSPLSLYPSRRTVGNGRMSQLSSTLTLVRSSTSSLPTLVGTGRRATRDATRVSQDDRGDV